MQQLPWTGAMIFHIDANSFYASCEQMFRPDLADKPVAVLSNNDGVTISLNQRCKDLGFSRGDIYFKMKERYKLKGVHVFSSNYTLYADMSRRLNLFYSEYSADCEFYSIDESFLMFPDWTNGQYTELARHMQQEVFRQLHIPVSIGIAPTKTLAKLCNKLAKHSGGVCNWYELDQEKTLALYPAAEVWGIGAAKQQILSRFSVRSALDLARFPPEKAKKYLSETGYRTVRELNGDSLIDCQDAAVRQNITSSRSFARAVCGLSELETALAEYTQIAVSRMRSEKCTCRIVCVYLMTARSYGAADPGTEYHNGSSQCFERPVRYLPEIMTAALRLLHAVYRPGYEYRKIMVQLLSLERDDMIQDDLFDQWSESYERTGRVMSAADSINKKYGRGCLTLGVRLQTKETKDDGTSADWIMSRNFLSPEYTTDFGAIPVVQ
jgi:DNA polymerase V